jgi:hypothetical protein
MGERKRVKYVRNKGIKGRLWREEDESICIFSIFLFFNFWKEGSHKGAPL